jgi:hypothetical protein
MEDVYIFHLVLSSFFLSKISIYAMSFPLGDVLAVSHTWHEPYSTKSLKVYNMPLLTIIKQISRTFPPCVTKVLQSFPWQLFSANFFFWDRVSLCSPDWLQTLSPPASVFWVLGLGMCATMPSLPQLFICFVLISIKLKN